MRIRSETPKAKYYVFDKGVCRKSIVSYSQHKTQASIRTYMAFIKNIVEANKRIEELTKKKGELVKRLNNNAEKSPCEEIDDKTTQTLLNSKYKITVHSQWKE